MTTPTLSAQLFFLYDTHCPWSYVVTPLINEITKAFPNIELHLWHAAYFDGRNDSNTNSKNTELDQVEKLANITFSGDYRNILDQSTNSTLSANLMTWAQNKTPSLALTLLNALQQAHFEQGNKLAKQSDFDDIIATLKISPPAKIFKDKLNKDVLIQLEEIYSLQEIIQTEAIPALLLAIDDKLVLLSHNFYLTEPKAIIDAVQLELNKHT
ncbi:DsbA family protein [Candidatus Colwellia aromaticivorans]|uniref:DsbA family protein n=1 Tax=Candidatus Colwellia aromaticivorans TaxID=2267621 RepID=UPI000DF4A05F|nr:DsbA family protein [Candidatus Colwellia aromaticivorans]